MSKGALERVLAYGLRERAKVMDMMKQVPPEMEEYDMLQVSLEKLEDVLAEVRRQLSTRAT